VHYILNSLNGFWAFLFFVQRKRLANADKISDEGVRDNHLSRYVLSDQSFCNFKCDKGYKSVTHTPFISAKITFSVRQPFGSHNSLFRILKLSPVFVVASFGMG
jgi:hypothetical protein